MNLLANNVLSNQDYFSILMDALHVAVKRLGRVISQNSSLSRVEVNSELTRLVKMLKRLSRRKQTDADWNEAMILLGAIEPEDTSLYSIANFLHQEHMLSPIS